MKRVRVWQQIGEHEANNRDRKFDRARARTRAMLEWNSGSKPNGWGLPVTDAGLVLNSLTGIHNHWPSSSQPSPVSPSRSFSLLLFFFPSSLYSPSLLPAVPSTASSSSTANYYRHRHSTFFQRVYLSRRYRLRGYSRLHGENRPRTRAKSAGEIGFGRIMEG